MTPVRAQLATLFHQEAGQVRAALIASLGDFDLAEDALQDAFVVALEHWPEEGIPSRPGAWLMTVARRRAIDRIRRSQAFTTKLALVQHDAEQDQVEMFRAPEAYPDERLKLLFTCCHPALALETRVALTLHTLGGLSTAEIARTFVVPLPTMAQRLTRAKRKILDAGIPYRVPPLDLLPERLAGVLAVLYLLFTAGYVAAMGDQLMRVELCVEAIRLARLLVTLLSREALATAEAQGLLALMLLQHARRAARVDATGALIVLEDQDRELWERDEIREGCTLVAQALQQHTLGPYQVQAAIAALHAQASTPAATDWPQIAALYTVLLGLMPSPVVALNRAVAYAMADGPQVGLCHLADPHLAAALADYHLYHAARADLLCRVGRYDEARAAYQQALSCCANTVEQYFLHRRLSEIDALS